ncbi:Non-repetitive/WGA-negative nucleoporin C-terminal-domain-containing protein [Lasiosphaeria miniovina]|uniref:Non-repetitive/WGA-negative nucleoporin C-terminal-domain-containing protein n=1 Tax=Lasiosphaeria miniovina TaxID=1954250 RepID=A0AA40EAY4_9PEZI|nr:Non-repetitive/WGA-negative nucleoporin C-terminal-domain-containing protein [Lasiosphaeria miniovina]KAK0733265.1 Non-repetitive/WGA-negative nucleoporin C-terminal-domain-containing protein [Lasiosphaeria miniovina]
MFSPALQEGGPAKGTRSNRRRQRPLSSDASVQQPKAKRQRVPLSETTFVNPDAPPEMFEVKSDKIDVLGIKRDGIENVAAIVPRKELSVRSKKPKPSERTSKGDGSVVLTTNNAFTVSKLPALPDRLRADAQNRQHGTVYSSSGYALSLTHTHAFVWPYTSIAPSPETFTFTLPYPSKYASDPLPLASLVAPSASSEEPGLVVIMPVSGKIAYWESISSAATLDFIRQQRTGVEDSISGMFSGEHVTQIVNAESAGFILVFSSGRLAYMNVRDSHGRPGISVQFLRNGLSSGGGGFFGSIRHALSSSAIRGEIAAVRASYGKTIGERVIVAATVKGKLHSWKIHRGGHHEPLIDIDIRDQLVEAVQEADPATADLLEDSLEVVDFTFVPRGLEKKYVQISRLSEALSNDEDSLQHLLLLVSFPGKRKSRYSLVEVVISPEGIRIGMVRPFTSYTSPLRSLAPAKPRIYLPRPALVAFVVFDRAVVVASMASPPDSPDSQLQEDSHIIPATYEDVVDFRDDDTLQIVGSGTEEPIGNGQAHDELRVQRFKTKNPAAVLLLQGIGTLRVAVADIDRFASDLPPQVTAKSKLEQAVFFGIKEDNPLVFQGKRELAFSSQEIGNAAIELSHEIVSSKTSLIANLPASLEINMKTRSAYLDALITYLNMSKVDLDTRTRWLLLYNAEKMAVGTWIWQKHEQFLAERAKGDKKNLISETAVYINEHQKTEPNPAIGEVDAVRHWFINDVWRLDIFVAWGYQIIKYAWTERLADEAGINRLLWEAVTVNNGGLLEAHQYRTRNGPLYGVNAKEAAGGNAIPEPWTATHFITNNLKRLVEFCYQWLDTYSAQNPDQPVVDQGLLDNIQQTLPSLTSQYFTALIEFSSWASKSDDPQAQELAKTYEQNYVTDVYDKILRLKDYGLWEEAIQLAIEYTAFDSLAEVVVQQILSLEQDVLAVEIAVSKDKDALVALLERKKKRMGELFDKYQEKFAFRAYTVLLEHSGIQAVLDFPYDHNGYATKFLRTKPELAKISWINDVQRENDIDHAASTLLELGLSREQQVWSKKIELSLGKLALLAEEGEQSANRSGSSDNEAKTSASLSKIDKELDLIKIQDALYSQILPSIEEAVDESAELELAMKEHAGLIPKKQKALLQIFEDGMSRLLKHEALQPPTLIDLLTLAYLHPDHWKLIGDQFFLALKVAQHGLKGKDRSNAERLIWRRCYLRDDWKQVNETNQKGDHMQLKIVGETAAYHTMFKVEEEMHSDVTFDPYVKPSEALGVFTESLDGRFKKMDESFRNKLLESMKWEDSRLGSFLEKSQLENWYRSTRDCAEKTVASEIDRLTTEANKAAPPGAENRLSGFSALNRRALARTRGIFEPSTELFPGASELFGA